MLGTAVLASIAQQMMSSNAVDVNGKPVPVSRTNGHRLRTLPFTMDGREYQAIEQNAEKPSRWGNWRGRGTRLSSSRTWVPTNLWRSWLMEKSQCMGLGIGRENNERN